MSHTLRFCFLAGVSVVLSGRPAGAGTIYVDTNATGLVHDGSSWCSAYLYLQDALAAATSGRTFAEIRVADGIYKPDESGGQTPGDRDATFQLLNGVTVAGGYAGCGAPNPDEHDIAAFETILSGDLAGDDVEVPVEDLADEPTRAENSYHVVTGSGTDHTAALEGFTVAGGYANGTGEQLSGAGMYISNGNPTVYRCSFEGNAAEQRGGGIYCWNSSATMLRCTLRENVASLGAGMSTQYGHPIVTECTFRRNSAESKGGGMHITGGPNNTATVTQCIFRENAAGLIGGGMYIAEMALVTDCIFRGNSAVNRGGGGMYILGASPDVHNSLFVGNVGTGLTAEEYTETLPRLFNCTFTLNHGGGCYAWNGSSVYVYHSILWDNYGRAIDWETDGEYGIALASVAVYNCDVQGYWRWGSSNVDADPLFVPGPGGCFYLSRVSAGQAVDSPCIDAGGDTSANLGLDALTTSSDESVDTGVVDLGFHYPVTGLPLVMGDYDYNQTVNLADVAGLQNCLSGAGTGSVPPCCRILDFEPDGDVDLDDLVAFLAAMAGR